MDCEILKIQDGDLSGFDEFARSHLAIVHEVARKYFYSLFLGLNAEFYIWRAAIRYRDGENCKFSSFLYKFCHWSFRKEGRKNQHYFLNDDINNVFNIRLPDAETYLPSAYLDYFLSFETVKTKEIILMRCQGLSFAEIGRHLDLTREAVRITEKNFIGRARNRANDCKLFFYYEG